MKTALITGCSSGYGLETARHFHSQGWKVFATMRTPRADLLPRSERLVVLPLDVRVLTVEEMPDGFHARFDARSKTYEYRIVNAPLVSAFLHRYVWHIPQPLDAEAMRTAAGALIGRHDFAGFQGTGTPVASTERTILALEVEDGGGFDLPLVIRVTGDGFLRHMVRNIVGTLVEVGVGRWDPWRPLAVLDSKDRSQAGRTAPPQGLFLTHVGY